MPETARSRAFTATERSLGCVARTASTIRPLWRARSADLMPDARTDQTWGTSQLVEFLAVLSGQLDEAMAMRAAVERVLESLDAEIGVLLDADGAPVVVVGLRADDKRLFHLIGIGLDTDQGSTVKGLGECRTACAA